MNASALIDTGAILALLDRDDEWHSACRQAFNSTPLPLLTTEAVLTESFHLTSRDLGDIRGLWTLLSSGSLRVEVTLVHLAARDSLSLILTIDHDDFETYRIGGRKKFTILPGRGTIVTRVHEGSGDY